MLDHRTLLLLAGLFGATGVMAGAFGAHALRATLGASLPTWQTAVQYHLVHALALLALAAWQRSEAVALANWSGWLFAAGIMLFSGSLYGLALGGPRWLGPVTPLGGSLLIGGWLLMIVQAVKN